jgi:peptide/nickel transport system permease protein
LGRDRFALASAILLALLIAAALAAPLYADHVAHTTPEDNHLTEQVGSAPPESGPGAATCG